MKNYNRELRYNKELDRFKKIASIQRILLKEDSKDIALINSYKNTLKRIKKQKEIIKNN